MVLNPSCTYLMRDFNRRSGEMSTVMLAATPFRRMHLARVLRDLGQTVMETYPGAAWSPRAPTLTDREAILEARVTRFRAGNADECDAIAAALVAGDRAQGRAEPLKGADGTIWLPAKA